MSGRKFELGDRVRVTGRHAGPLFGREGVVTSADGHGVTVRLDGKREHIFWCRSGAFTLTHLRPEESAE